MLKSVSKAFYDQKKFLKKNIFPLKTKGGTLWFWWQNQKGPPFGF